jgi:hypothetical protein
MVSEREERPIFIDVAAFRAACAGAPLRIVGLVPLLLGYGGGGAFQWDARAIASWLSRECPNDRILAEELENIAADLAPFFTALPDGRWVPSPVLFSAVDGNPGSAS